jgi:hypothetical protein
MADGEKKRFGNFAEYAKARQAGKIGGSDQFQISSQVHQQPFFSPHSAAELETCIFLAH